MKQDGRPTALQPTRLPPTAISSKSVTTELLISAGKNDSVLGFDAVQSGRCFGCTYCLYFLV